MQEKRLFKDVLNRAFQDKKGDRFRALFPLFRDKLCVFTEAAAVDVGAPPPLVEPIKLNEARRKRGQNYYFVAI